MLFVKEALEQATHEAVAAYHASKFPVGELVVDMTCGIGADSIALAKRGPTSAFDLDEDRVAYARWNLSVHGLSAEVTLGDSLAQPAGAYAFADPARRVDGRRTRDAAKYSPNPADIVRHLTNVRLGGIKLSPLLPDAYLEGLGGRLEFLSFGGECREAIVWLGSEVAPRRVAVHVESGLELDASETYLPPCEEPQPGHYFYEADPAAIRAHGLPALAQDFGLQPLADTNGYLVGPSLVESPWLRGFEVLYHGRGGAKETRAALRELGGGRIVVKSRGLPDLDPAKMAKQLNGDGPRELTVVAWQLGKSVKHTIVSLG
jgi:hypothetical protein